MDHLPVFTLHPSKLYFKLTIVKDYNMHFIDQWKISGLYQLIKENYADLFYKIYSIKFIEIWRHAQKMESKIIFFLKEILSQNFIIVI